jgi:hypothetical protein
MCFVLVTYYPLQSPSWDVCLQYDSDTVCTDHFVVQGCDSQALNEALSSLATCNLLVPDVCQSTCLTNIIKKIRNIGCLKNDVRELLVMFLGQQNQQQAINAANLVWQCAGLPPVVPPSGCITTTKPIAKTTVKTTVKTTAKPASKTTKKPKRKQPKKPKKKNSHPKKH